MKKFLFVVVLVLFACTAFSQKANFTGSWKLNETESRLFDQFTLAPSSMVIAHKKKSFEVERVNNINGQELIRKETYTLDGKECENPGWIDGTITSTADWDKKAGILKVVSKMVVEEMKVELQEEYKMNDEGKLVMQSLAVTDMGELPEIFVFDQEE